MPPGDETRPSLSRSTTATRSAPNSTRAWSLRSRTTSPTSSREVRSVATRRSASARRRRPLACSVALTPWIRTPRVRAMARARRWPSSRPSSTAPAMTRTPHGMLAARDADDELVRAHAQDRRRAVDRPGRAWIGSEDSSACENTLRPGGTVRPAVMPGPSTSVARETRPPGRISQIPTSAAPVATRTGGTPRRAPSPCRSGTMRSRPGRPAGRRPPRSRSASAPAGRRGAAGTGSACSPRPRRPGCPMPRP